MKQYLLSKLSSDELIAPRSLLLNTTDENKLKNSNTIDQMGFFWSVIISPEQE